MIEIAIMLTFFSIGSLVYYLGGTWMSRVLIKARMERWQPENHQKQIADGLDKPLLIRLLGPLINKISGFVMKFTPVNLRRRVETLLESAGYSGNQTVKNYLLIKIIILGLLPLITYGLIKGINRQSVLLIVTASLLFAVILPDFILKRLATARRNQILAALPDNLDLLTVSVEAGLGFDQALLKLVEKTTGPLTQEFKRVLHEIRIGNSRRDALREMSSRTGVEDLQVFTAAIIQADQLGVSIGNVLRIQSHQLRRNRRLKAEEKAQKAPVKMLIPMVIFIFPCLFIILLGPGILQLIDNFARMNK